MNLKIMAASVALAGCAGSASSSGTTSGNSAGTTTPDVPSSTSFAVGDCVIPGGSSTALTVINCSQASGGDLKIVKILKGEFRSTDCPYVDGKLSGTAGYDDVAAGQTLCMVYVGG